MGGASGDLAPPGQAPQRKSVEDDHLGPPHTTWGRVDYRMWWLKPGPLEFPLLVTPAGQVLAGGGDLEFGPTSGIGFEAGTWLDDRHTFGLAVGGFLTEQRSLFTAAASTGNPALLRPFDDAVLVAPGQLFVASPGALAGSFFTQATARLAGGEVYSVRNLFYCPTVSLDVLVGGRYFDLEESLSITQVTQPLGGTVLSFLGVPNPGITSLTLNDRFRTRNQWWGGTMGLRGEYRFGPATVGLVGKVGLGNNQQVVQIDGSTRAAGTGGGVAPGGLLATQGVIVNQITASAQIENVGKFTTHRFAVLTEVGVTLGVQLTRSARAFAGYDLFYLNNVVRPGQQIDPVVNTRQVPAAGNFGALTGITSPVVTGARDDFYVHGFRVGLELLF
jgi:hypothetical protein